MKAILPRDWNMIDHSKPENEEDVKVPAGEYELERIPNPYGFDGNWLVLRGTTTGMSEGSWRDSGGSRIPRNNILILEDDTPEAPGAGERETSVAEAQTTGEGMSK